MRITLTGLILTTLTGCITLFDDDLPPPPPCAERDDDCDGRDDDCDGMPDEDAPRSCPVPIGGRVECDDDGCTLTCDPDRHDLDGEGINGCEYTCTPSGDGIERCDGADDDCDGITDEGIVGEVVPGLHGVCVGARRACDGAAGFGPPRLEGLPGFEPDETRCDGLDNDCDGAVDEAHPIGEPCTAGLGACRRDAAWACDATGGAACDVAPGAPLAADDVTCDGIDDDCDGLVDEDPPCNGGPDGSPCGVDLPDGFVCIPPGDFVMGSPPDEPELNDDEGPQRRGTLSRPFLLGATEVTQAEWVEVMGDNPSHDLLPPLKPVERVSWYDALVYANRRSALDGYLPCYDLSGCPAQGERRFGCDEAFDCVGFECADVTWLETCDGWRLPTEAEWEYAARAGTTTRPYPTHRGPSTSPPASG